MPTWGWRRFSTAREKLKGAFSTLGKGIALNPDLEAAFSALENAPDPFDVLGRKFRKSPAILSKVGRSYDKIQLVHGARPGEIGEAKTE